MVPVAYNLRSLAVRRATTVATAGGVALVVAVFAAVMMLGQGISDALGRTGSPDVAIVLRKGSDAEGTSAVEIALVGLITAGPEVRQRGDGQPDSLAEIAVVVALDKVGAEGVSNVMVRGTSEAAFAFRPTVRITEGRRPRPGTDEAVVGAAIRGRFRGLEPGQSFEIRKNRPVRIVGVFADNGSSFESEVWTDADTARSASGRAGIVSAVRVRLRSPEAFEAFKRALESNRQLGVDVLREPAYYARQAEGTATLLQALGLMVAVLFAVGAMIGAMITMYAAVANRSREIGTLRALGFSRGAVLASFLLESVALALAGGVVGVLAALPLGLVRFSVVNFASFSELVFRFAPTPRILLSALLASVVMGLLGGLLPAVRAARVSVLDALRS